MKNRSRLKIFTTIFSVLACFGLAFGAGSPESPDPTPFPVNSNTADGFRALENSDNAFNSAFGWFSLFTNTDAFFNSGFGAGTLFFNDGADNTAVGTAAMFFNTSGPDNTAVGINALRDNTTGNRNCAFGSFALFNNQVAGNASNAFGFEALFNNDADGAGSGQFNNGFGWLALFNNVDGIWNTAMGDFAGGGITGDHNTAIGASTMGTPSTGSDNTVVGFGAGANLTAGSSNTYVGHSVGFTIGDEINTIRIADISIDGFGSAECFIGGIFNNFQPVGGTVVQVTLDLANDHLGWDLGPNQGGSAPQRQAMLNRKVEALEATVAQLTAQLKEQAAQIQKVSAQVEVSKPAPQVVVNKQ